MKPLVTFTLLVIATLSFAGCDSRWSAQKFASIPIRVNDSTTMLPIAGATVSPFCMGGTPYGTNVYHTDTQGIASVTFYDRSVIVAVRIESDGYETASLAMPATNPVVSLRRVQP
jgi:hypothetical protein